MIVFLIGMMGSGKSSIGKSLARLLTYNFMDTDMEIENKYQKKVSQIFEEKGEEAFRLMEQELLMNICEQGNLVVATGGGFPCFNKNMDVMNDLGLTIYLEAAPAFLVSRLKNAKHDRPLIATYSDDELLSYLEQLLAQRSEYYNSAKIHISAKSLKAQDIHQMIMKS